MVDTVVVLIVLVGVRIIVVDDDSGVMIHDSTTMTRRNDEIDNYHFPD
jgi:hypothetical protein